MKNSFSRFFGLGEKGDQKVELEKELETELEEELDAAKNEEIKKIPIDSIVPNRFQPRTVFDDEK